MGPEVWQFLIILLGFLVAAVLCLFVVYLPGRGKAGPSAGSGGQDGPLKPES